MKETSPQLIWKWLTGLLAPQSDMRTGTPGGQRPILRVKGRHAALHKYLNERYADSVVLTFDEIEDISGFPLPDRARNDGHWWTAASLTSEVAPYSDAWLRADRSALPNMAARKVTFERH